METGYFSLKLLWTSRGMTRRPVRAVDQFWCFYLLKGSEWWVLILRATLRLCETAMTILPSVRRTECKPSGTTTNVSILYIWRLPWPTGSLKPRGLMGIYLLHCIEFKNKRWYYLHSSILIHVVYKQNFTLLFLTHYVTTLHCRMTRQVLCTLFLMDVRSVEELSTTFTGMMYAQHGPRWVLFVRRPGSPRL
jgi:hypothetical protein